MKAPTRRQFIKKAAQGIAAAGIFSSGPSILIGQERHAYDLLIANGMLYDGSGREPRQADVGIRGDRIVATGRLDHGNSAEIIDAQGRAVCPGFIDVHTHTDISLLVDPKAESKIRQGVTLEIGGNCGDSVFPLAGRQAEIIRDEWRNKYGLEADWTDLAGFYERLQLGGMAFNYATLIGHGAIRSAAMGIENRPPSSAELRAMKKHLRAALEQGALGLSTGLEYTPGSFASTGELVELCKVVARQRGIYATHMRNEDLTVEEALAEAIRIGRESDVSVQISHLKASQQRNWHKTPALLAAIGEAQRQGMDIHADRYPYTAFATSLRMLFPLWAREGKDEDFVARLQDNAQWEKIAQFVRDKISALGSWSSIMITRAYTSGRSEYQGKTIEELAASANQDPLEFTRDLLISENGQVGMCGFGMSEADTEATLAAPFTMVGSDGDAISPQGKLGEGTPHPRFYGTFPRYLGYYIREKKILPLPGGPSPHHRDAGGQIWRQGKRIC